MMKNDDLKDVRKSVEKSQERDYENMERMFTHDIKRGNDIAKKHGTPGKDSTNTRSAKNLTKNERAERFYSLLDENIKLKTHQAILDGELVKTGTRLQRIKEMIARERKLNGGNFGIGFGHQIDEIIDSNTELSLDNDKLRSIIKGLKDRMAEMIKNGYNKPGMNTGGKRLTSAYKSSMKGGFRKRKRPTSSYKPTHKVPKDIGNVHDIKDKELAIQKLRENNHTMSDTINILKDEVEKRRNKESDLKRQVRDIADQLEDKDREIQRIERNLQAKNTENSKLATLKADNQSLKAQLITLQTNQGTAEGNLKYISDLNSEKLELERKLTSILTDPFFRREADNEYSKKMHELESENEKMREQLDKFNEEKNLKDEELHKLRNDYSKISDEHHHKIVNGTGYNFKMDGTIVDLDEMKKALLSMDPSVFRATMGQINHDGDEPLWAKIDFLEQMGVDIDGDPSDPKAIARRMELMRHDKRELAASLEKAQQLLKLQYDIERENKEYYKTEADELNTRIKELTMRLEESRKIADQRFDEINELKSITSKIRSQYKSGYDPKDEKETKDYPRIDADTDFSLVTGETDLKPDENMLDLALDKAEYYSHSLNQVVESDVISDKGFLSFATVEFYDHDCKATVLTNGLEPEYLTLFSFKNKIDDYYIQYLQTNRIKVEVFLSKAQKVKKIGFANITLREIVERDYDTMDGMKTPVISGIINISSSADPSLRIGVIKYKMRMRKTLNEALKWFREKNELNIAQRSKKVTQKYLATKVISINVIRCTDLKSIHNRNPKRIKPFFFYNFYKFDDFTSRTYEGTDPEMNEMKTFTTEIDDKFRNYTEEKTFEITVFDDGINPPAVEDDNRIDDMIGVVHIPLFEVAKGNNLWDKYTIKDYNGNVNGMLEVKITLHNSLEDINAPYAQSFDYRTDDWSKEFLFKVCLRFSSKENMNLNSLFAIFSKGEENISRRNFRETIIPKKCGVSESEIEMFVKDCEPFQRRGYMTQEQFISYMKGPFRRAVNEERIRRKELKHRRDSDDDEEDFKRATQSKADSHRNKEYHNKHSSALRKEDHRPSRDREDTIGGEETKAATRFSQSDVDKVKEKIKEFILKDEISLQLFYEFIDKNNDKRIDINEFTSKLMGLKIDITEAEGNALFHYIDLNNSQEITYKEFSTSLHDVNMAYILQKVRKIMKTVNMDLEQLFSDFDSKDKRYWNDADYNEFVGDYCSGLEKFEVKDLYEYLDKDGDKKIQKSELGKALYDIS